MTAADPIGPEMYKQASGEEPSAPVSAASRVTTAPTYASDAEQGVAVVSPSDRAVLATLRSAAVKYASTPTQLTHPAQTVEHAAVEITYSSEEGEPSPPNGKERAVAPSSTPMEVDKALPEGARRQNTSN